MSFAHVNRIDCWFKTASSYTGKTIISRSGTDLYEKVPISECNCASSLTQIGFVAPPIPFNLATTTVDVSSSYLDIFTENLSAGCTISGCKALETGCL